MRKEASLSSFLRGIHVFFVSFPFSPSLFLSLIFSPSPYLSFSLSFSIFYFLLLSLSLVLPLSFSVLFSHPLHISLSASLFLPNLFPSLCLFFPHITLSFFYCLSLFLSFFVLLSNLIKASSKNFIVEKCNREASQMTFCGFKRIKTTKSWPMTYSHGPWLIRMYNKNSVFLSLIQSNLSVIFSFLALHYKILFKSNKVNLLKGQQIDHRL